MTWVHRMSKLKSYHNHSPSASHPSHSKQTWLCSGDTPYSRCYPFPILTRTVRLINKRKQRHPGLNFRQMRKICDPNIGVGKGHGFSNTFNAKYKLATLDGRPLRSIIIDPSFDQWNSYHLKRKLNHNFRDTTWKMENSHQWFTKKLKTLLNKEDDIKKKTKILNNCLRKS